MIKEYRLREVTHSSCISPVGTVLIILWEEGPLGLTRRQMVPVWDDEVESTHEMFKVEDEVHHESEDPFEDHEDRPSSPHASISTMPLPAPAERLSFTRPRMQKPTSNFLNFTRPVSFSTTYSKVHPGITGVAVLEQLERLDAVEASLKKLGGGIDGDNSGNADCEVHVAESPTSPSTRNGRLFGPVSAPGRMSRSSSSHTHNNDDGVPPMMTASFSGPSSPGGIPNELPAVAEETPSSNASRVGDEDVAQMSKSMSYMDGRPSLHSRWLGQDGNKPRLDWIIDEGETPKPKVVLVEVRTFSFFRFHTG